MPRAGPRPPGGPQRRALTAGLLGVVLVAVLLAGLVLRPHGTPGTRMTDGGEYWGVDSVATLGSRIASVQEAYDATPSFWGRYLSDCTGHCGSDLTRAEAHVDLDEGIRLLLVVADRGGRWDRGRGNGAADGTAAAVAARALGVPAGVAIFKDLESGSRVNGGFIVGFYEEVEKAGYVPGYYLNAEPGQSGGAAYCAAVGAYPGVGSSYIWASESEPDAFASTPPNRAPAYGNGAFPAVFPSCAGRKVVWQYSEADHAGVDEDEAITLAPFWR